MSQFSCVGLIGRLDSDNAAYSLRRLISFLAKQNIEVMLDEETAEFYTENELEIVSRETLAKRCDLIIVVGGDGSLLSAARAFAGKPVKLLGINRGRLGFLTDISPDEIEYKVGEVLAGKYVSESRFLLHSQLYRGEELISEAVALNDVVMHPGQFIRMIEFELYINDEFVYRQRSDGLIISSPTGATAYALSCGGPIMHPSLDAIVLVPMNPHTLSSRPIVVHGSSRIRLLIAKDNHLSPHITNDGQTHVVTKPGDEVVVTKSPDLLELIHPTDHNFYETCRSKLGWASHTGGC
ncbi:NAD(+) kinase [Saccharophagus degradans]|uniref:NAD kinase n=1 Tax=Saccharophagus degradans (strain 2-40 / ATCC 43961 / DSM 17024) TaxID=203122 RepID=NADK_SACD2|nr:NAD(+) kinase [Saccharophagus degradans]Q21JY6.1 RecName: Full=NAD kinase; AltName: Full=ATP-dependent NAD kinase [Saccharophagus degradans 2-40]ABD80993.1 NAD(+) kinase [Saccharophagus degradans 2-40]